MAVFDPTARSVVDASSAGIGDHGRQNRGGSIARTMRADHSPQRLCAYQGRIARQNDHDLGISQCAARHEHRVSRPMLRLLQNSFRVERLSDRRDLLGLMP